MLKVEKSPTRFQESHLTSSPPIPGNTGAAAREIPFNYTSAGDRQVVNIILGSRGWELLEALRSQRITGRSSKLLLRIVGEIFLFHRNPYLREECITNPSRLRALRRSVENDLSMVHQYANENPEVLELLDLCRSAVNRLLRQMEGLPSERRAIRAALGRVIGPENVSFEPFALVAHSTDATDWRLHLPVAVARPRSEQQVGPLVRAIAALGMRIIPRGGGTGLTGGAIPVAEKCVIINTESLNRIGPVTMAPQVGDPGAPPLPVLPVEAGVITEDAMHASAEAGWVFATDPTSAWASTIGGNIAENAGGKRAVLWGTAIDNLLSFRIVLPDGRHWSVHRVNHPLRKILPADDVIFQVWNEDERFVRAVRLTGREIRKPGLWKDITNKALGGLPGLQKEGTDGIITSAQFVLHPPYPHARTFCIEFFGPTMDEAGLIILELSRRFPNRGEEVLMALEHFDDEYVRAIHYRTKAPRSGSPAAVLLLDLVGHTQGQVERGTASLEAILARYPDSYLIAAADEAEGERFWADRKRLGAIARRTNAFKLNEDVVLPLDRLADYCGYLANVNLEEERFIHREVAEAIAREIRDRGLLGGDERLEAKTPAALSLCDGLTATSRAAAREPLRSGELLGSFLAAIRDLFAGYDAILARVESIVAETRGRLIVIASHMHAGDGNVHVNIPVLSNDRKMMERATAAADRAMVHAVSLGGVVSGEHGIGVTKFKHLEQGLVDALASYRASVDPGGIMNPGKLSDPRVPDLMFTPSFNLLELEARILRHGSLERLADEISRCVRCGKCKADCCVFSPAGGMFYHPRNKNLAIGSVVEALLYDAQRNRATAFELLRYLREIADHCTICHKCLPPCPVDIDTGAVTLLEREILESFGQKRTPLVTRATLGYLQSRSVIGNALFRTTVVRWGGLAQRAASRVAGWVSGSLRIPAPHLVRSAPTAPSRHPARRWLPACGTNQALLLRPEGEILRSVFYFPGCGSERLHGEIGAAAVYLLLRGRCQVVLPPPFLCCGFPLEANGRKEDHDKMVLANTILFSQIREMLRYLPLDACAVSCGTCLEGLRATGIEETMGGPLVDVAAYVLGGGLRPGLAGSYGYHRPCHDSLDGRAAEILGSGVSLHAVPHCCSEAGTLSLSRPDITNTMLEKKGDALRMDPLPDGTHTVLTNCPSCVSGLGRSRGAGFRPEHLAVALAKSIGGEGWKNELEQLAARHELVNF